jgi:hypothetical protein
MRRGRRGTYGRVRWLAAVVGLLAAAAVPTPAQGSVTIGHVLGTGPPGPLFCFPACTFRQASLAPEDGRASDGLLSPVNGVVTSFGVSVVAANQDSDLTVRLRVLRGQAGAGSSPPVILRDADGIQTFPTQLPISVGDGIGIDSLPAAAPGNIGIGRGTAAGNSVLQFFSPPLLDGGSQQSPQASAGGVLDMNAVIQPTNDLNFGKVARNKKKGTARLSVNVPNAGALVIGGKGVKGGRGATSAAGVVNLTIKAKGKTRKKLNQAGKASVAPKVTFTPTGGDANSESRKLRLIKR